MEDKIVMRRVKILTKNYWRKVDANGVLRSGQCPPFAWFISTEESFRSKTHTTTAWTSKYKMKFSPNSCRCWWRYKGDMKTREEQDKEFLNILKEHGIG